MEAYRESALAYLRQVIGSTGKTATELARLVDVSSTTFTRPLNNPDFKYPPKFQTLRRLAEATGIPLPVDLLTLSSTPAGSRATIRQLPIRGKVAAGLWRLVDHFADQPLGEAPMVESVRYAGIDQWAELIEGPSMDRHYAEGDFVHVVDAIGMGYRPLKGDHVIVERRSAQDGKIERACKAVDVVNNQVIVRGDSADPRWNEPLPLDGAGDDSTVQVVGKVIGSYRPRRD
jgi:hypothetical protein